MDFDDQLRRYFGSADLASIPPAAVEAGVERMRVDLGLEQDRSRRFALWAVLAAYAIVRDFEVPLPVTIVLCAVALYVCLADSVIRLFRRAPR